MRGALLRVASARRFRLRVHAYTPVSARRATASSQRLTVRNTATTTPSVAVTPHSRALLRWYRQASRPVATSRARKPCGEPTITRAPMTTSSGSGLPVADHRCDSAPAGAPEGTPAGLASVWVVAAASEFRHSRAATTTRTTVTAVHIQTRNGGDGMERPPFRDPRRACESWGEG